MSRVYAILLAGVCLRGNLTCIGASRLNAGMDHPYNALADFLRAAKSIVVLSGAGVSTGSGIPDYRNRNGDWKHAQPILYADFVRNPASRQRYWARSYVGYRRFAAAEPNTAHRALATLEASGKVDTLITQNVDRLHSRAGSRQVIDLHGDLSKVRCLDCDAVSERSGFQAALAAANPDWHAEVFRFNPDGDAELAVDSHADFVVPPCTVCAGLMKPHVVMFGEAVPRARVAAATAAVDRADALLVTGSSLMVFSGFRFARQARAQQKPLVIINRGRTRADDIATLKVDADCAEALTAGLQNLAA